MKILLILPAYNEQENILQTVNKIKEYSNELDYIVINDGSTDDTEEIAPQFPLLSHQSPIAVTAASDKSVA